MVGEVSSGSGIWYLVIGIWQFVFVLSGLLPVKVSRTNYQLLSTKYPKYQIPNCRVRATNLSDVTMMFSITFS
jgi:hypothetical protein